MTHAHRDLLGGPDPVLLPANAEADRELAEVGMAHRVTQACEALLSAGTSPSA